MRNMRLSKLLSIILAITIVISTQTSTTVLAATKNSAPVISQGKSLSVSTTKNKANSFTLSAKDSNGDAITFTVSKAPKKGTVKLAKPTTKGSGSARVYSVKITYTPKSGFTGSDTLAIIAKDSKGAKSSAITVKVNVDALKVVEVVSPTYDEIHPFEEGMAQVLKNEKWGFIDTNGKVIVKPKYDYAEAYNPSGYARVMSGGKWGYIDKKGKEVIPLKYSTLYAMSEGIAIYSVNGKYGFVNANGKEITTAKYNFVQNFSNGTAWVQSNRKCGYIDKNGKEIIPVKYNLLDEISEGIAAYQLNGKWGFVDINGKELTEAKYDVTYNFRDGLATVRINGSYGFVDKTGKEILSPTYYWYNRLFDDVIVIQAYDNAWYELINRKGELITEYKYSKVEDISEGLALVAREAGYGYIDKTGKEVIPAQFGSAMSFSDGLAAVYDYEKSLYGYIDKTGKLVIPYSFDYASSFSEGIAVVRVGSKDKIIDKTGKVVAEIEKEFRRFEYGSFKDGLVWHRDTDKSTGKLAYGLIDKNGKVLTDCKYYEVESFENGLAKVARGEYGMIDKNGNEILTTSYRHLIHHDTGWITGISNLNSSWAMAFNKDGKLLKEGTSLSFTPFSDSLLAVNSYSSNESYVSFIDTKGNKVIESTKYASVGSLNDGIAPVQVYTGAKGTKDPSLYKTGVIDKNGKELIAPTLKYNSLEYVNNNLYAASVNGKWGLVKFNK